MKLKSTYTAKIIGTGSYLPGNPIPYDDVERVLGELDEVDEDFKKWYKRSKRTMKQLLGMEHYFFAVDPDTGKFTETPSTLAAKAAQKAIAHAGLEPNDIEAIFYAGCAQDAFVCPPTSVFVQEHLGIERCAEYSIHANCTSTYKAVQMAADQIALGRYKTVLVTSANMVSGYGHVSCLNQKALTRHQAMLRWFLCDGGGAMVLRRDTHEAPGFNVLDSFVESIGIHEAPQMYSKYGTASIPAEALARGDHHITQDFKEVSSKAPAYFVDGFERFVDQLEVDPRSDEFLSSVTHFLANVPTDHIVDAGFDEYSRRFKVPKAELRRAYYSSVGNRGYTGPASLPITLDDLFRNRKVENGKYVISFVTESSKWMNAGLYLQYVEP